MPITLYEMVDSPPCRAVLMTAAKLNIEFQHKYLDYMKEDHLKLEFVAINPVHTVPTIDDNGFILWESRAILTYLVNKYAPGNSLYPENPQIRAAVDKMLYFDIGTLYKSLLDFMMPLWMENKWPSSEQDEGVKKALTTFEELLGKTKYAACDHLTVADHSLLAGLSTVVEAGAYSIKPFPRITAWYEKMKSEIPNFQKFNVEPMQEFKKMVEKAKLTK